ncbi:neprosin family prolyl endopeptidase [Dyella tabacisoli]|uniref:DUF239 domain-containing protein n=1 Tax=Dyella tabacisoli TaxID=2282381 RepID=A0A369URA9_9GAMM|nr:neprosin family prolyl endopeptidase [Dyella tabacisoli]RDD83051.1 DUF239 domain-containing protein [Dyella tabacisoli]
MKSTINYQLRSCNERLPWVLGALFALAGSFPLAAQANQTQFVSFQQFMENTHSSHATNFVLDGNNKVKSEAAFEDMRQHVLHVYEGVQVQQSFVLGGDYFDCVPMLQQPGARQGGLKAIAAPPPVPTTFPSVRIGGNDGTGLKQPQAVTSQLAANEKIDEYGHSRICSEGTIPMRRITLKELSRFPTLRDYFQKAPDGAEHVPSKTVYPPSAVAHKYAYTYQYVNNTGQTDTINLWSPYVDTGLGEIFSLAQSWTIAYTPVLQTAEVGWQNYPGLYGNQSARLFIYWTADGYGSTGCYNLSCGAFVQVNGSWFIGGPFANYSTVGGAQYEFTAQFYLFQGNWWLGLGSPSGITWVGYYPGSIYGSGPMRTNAQLLEFGSESVGSNPWPPEGSGYYASNGWSYAAYQRQLYYWDYPNANAIWDSLTVAQPSPSCYTIAGPYWGGYTPPTNYWGTYFYFGGPGGYGC